VSTIILAVGRDRGGSVSQPSCLKWTSFVGYRKVDFQCNLETFHRVTA
jgi:hypothetical protein